MLLLNFSHPLTRAHLESITSALGAEIAQILDLKTHFDPALPFPDQARALIDGIALSAHDWQTTPLLINPPSLSVITCVVLAELHGRMGYFPPIIRLRPVANTTPPQFEVAEIVNLQGIRDAARGRR